MTAQMRIDANHHHIINLKDDNGMFYAPRFNFNNLPFWNLARGYQVKIDTDFEAVWEGERIPADTDIPLIQGWNTVAYFPTYELDASSPDFYALSPIIDQVLYAKDVDALFIAPVYNFSDMDPWHETQGYKVAVRENVVLNYPVEPGQDFALAGSRQPTASASFKSNINVPDQLGNSKTHWSGVQRTSQNMSVLVLSAATDQFQAGDEIAAYNSDGVQTGSGMVNEAGQCGFAVWGDDVLTAQNDGMREGEAFELRCWRHALEIESPVEVERIVLGNGLQYSADELLVLELSLRPEAVAEFHIGEWYPNPFNADTFLKFGLPDADAVQISIYDLQGRLVELLLDEEFTAGHHSVRWNAAGMSAGVYLVRIQAGDVGQVSKVVLVK